jgi:hypothetical protein
MRSRFVSFIFFAALLLAPGARAQTGVQAAPDNSVTRDIDPGIAAQVYSIKAIDNHAHPVLPPPNDKSERDFDALPVDNMEPETDVVAWRTDNPQLPAAWSRCATLGHALWGKNADDPRSQLVKSPPDLPSGFEVTDYRELMDLTARLASLKIDDPKNAWIRPWLRWSFTKSIHVGAQDFTDLEARVEIVRRAIEYLEGF